MKGSQKDKKHWNWKERIIIGIYLIVILYVITKTFMPVTWYPCIKGYIYNPFLMKKYPRKVIFESGMSIMPGQTAILGAPMSIIKNKDGTTTVKWE